MGCWRWLIDRRTRWWALTGAERRVLISAAGLLAEVSLALRLGGLRLARAWLDRRVPSGREGGPLDAPDPRPLVRPWLVFSRPLGREATPISPERTARLAASAARIIPGSTCLARALVVQALLRSQGTVCDLRIGVRKTRAGWQAHAWVELDGRTLGGDAGDYVAFAAAKNSLAVPNPLTGSSRVPAAAPDSQDRANRAGGNAGQGSNPHPFLSLKTGEVGREFLNGGGAP